MEKNQIAMIKNLDSNGRPVNEGKARLVERLGVDEDHRQERWKVEFLSDGFVCDRWVSQESE